MLPKSLARSALSTLIAHLLSLNSAPVEHVAQVISEVRIKDISEALFREVAVAAKVEALAEKIQKNTKKIQKKNTAEPY